jgi:hypothetical protein
LSLSSQGKAHCFEKVDSKLVERFVIEPITAASLESMVASARGAVDEKWRRADNRFGRCRARASAACLTRAAPRRAADAPTSFLLTTGVKVGDVLAGETSALPVRASVARPQPPRQDTVGPANAQRARSRSRSRFPSAGGVCGRVLLRGLEVPAGVRGAHVDATAPAGVANVRARARTFCGGGLHFFACFCRRTQQGLCQQHAGRPRPRATAPHMARVC